MSRYRLTRTARRDLEEIFGYWADRVNDEAALRVISQVLEAITVFSTQPRSGVAAAQFGEHVRKFPVGSYIVYYRPGRTSIQILHVFHGMRDQASAWQQ